MVELAQLVRAPGCGPGGRGFESHISPQRIRASAWIFFFFRVKYAVISHVEVNIKYKDMLKKAGMEIVGVSPEGELPEVVEIPSHPWFIGVQYHPELKSKPFDPHPLFIEFIKASIKQSRLV